MQPIQYNEQYAGGVTPFSLGLREEVASQKATAPNLSIAEKTQEGLAVGSAIQESEELRQFKEVLKQGKEGAKATLSNLQREGYDVSRMPNPDLIRTSEDVEDWYENTYKIIDEQMNKKKLEESSKKVSEAYRTGGVKEAVATSLGEGVDLKNIDDLNKIEETENKTIEAKAIKEKEEKAEKSFADLMSKYRNSKGSEEEIKAELDELTSSEFASTPNAKARAETLKKKLDLIEKQKDRINSVLIQNLKGDQAEEARAAKKKEEEAENSEGIGSLLAIAQNVGDTGPLVGTWKTIANAVTGGAAYGNEKMFEDMKKSLGPKIAKTIGGDSGRLSNQDVQYGLLAIPTIYDDDKVYKAKLALLAALDNKEMYSETELKRLIVSIGKSLGAKPHEGLHSKFSAEPPKRQRMDVQTFLLTHDIEPTEEAVDEVIRRFYAKQPLLGNLKSTSQKTANQKSNPQQVKSAKQQKLDEIDKKMKALEQKINSGS